MSLSCRVLPEGEGREVCARWPLLAHPQCLEGDQVRKDVGGFQSIQQAASISIIVNPR